MIKKHITKLIIRSGFNKNKHQGLLSFAGNTYICSLGKKSITVFKTEGDSATPKGAFKILYGFYRSDRIKLPPTSIPMIEINEKMGWCDEPTSPQYNKLVQLPFKQSHEVMMRKDRLYDICLVLDYNISKKARHKGSAIFFHQTKYTQNNQSNAMKLAPTLGCIAIDPELMLQLLPKLSSNTVVEVLT